MQQLSTVSRLKGRLAKVVDGLADLIKQIPIHQERRRHDDIVVLIGPTFYWGQLSAEVRAGQIALKRQYEPIAELLRLLLRQAPKELLGQLEDLDKRFRVWLELEQNWDLSGDSAANEAALRSVGTALEKILEILEFTGSSRLVVVPDTNSLLAEPDPTKYRICVGADSFVFMLLPTVLGELDRLKIEHRNPELREKARSTIVRIKGWRGQGSLTSGAKVDKSITVQACHQEPDMEKTLSWLDEHVMDDRIVASVLALQVEQPSARVLLVTGDINLQNKADAAFIEYVDSP